jgi:hypothetical protein
MRLREEIEERLRVLTQALYFSHVHRGELSEEARVKLRILEENIHLLQWCLSETDVRHITWGTVREAFHFFAHLLWQKLSGSRARNSQSGAGCAADREVTL